MNKKSLFRLLSHVRRNSYFVILLLFIFVFLFSSFFIKFKKNGDNSVFLKETNSNHWLEICIPSHNGSQMFRYQNEFKNLQCIPRERVVYEMKRIIGINPYATLRDVQFTAVIGSNTAVGSSIVSILEAQKKPYIALHGLCDIDLKILFNSINRINFSKAIICIQRPIIRGSSFLYETDVSMLIKSYVEFFTAVKVPHVIAMQPPYSASIMKIAEWFETPLILVPYTIPHNDILDTSNPIQRAILECKSFGRTTVIDNNGYDIHNPTSEEIATFLLNYNQKRQKNHERIIGVTSSPLQDIIGEKINGCNVTFIDGYDYDRTTNQGTKKIVLGQKQKSPMKQYSTYLQNFVKIDDSKPYLSIIVSGNPHTNGNYSIALQNYLKMLEFSLSYVQLANIELIIVDNVEDNVAHRVIKELSFLSHLKHRMRIVKIPPQFNGYMKIITKTNYSFFENSAMNFGILSAKGDYVLLTSVYDLLSTDFFEFVSSRSFNDGIIYRANRADLHPDYVKNLDFDALRTIVDSPWTHQDNMNIAPYCLENYYGSRYIQKRSDFRLNFICSPMSFLLASRKYWIATGGIPEISKKSQKDSIIFAHFMNCIYGFVIHYLPQSIVHPRYTSEEPLYYRHEDTELFKELICKGTSNDDEYFPNILNIASSYTTKDNIY